MDDNLNAAIARLADFPDPWRYRIGTPEHAAEQRRRNGWTRYMLEQLVAQDPVMRELR